MSGWREHKTTQWLWRRAARDAAAGDGISQHASTRPGLRLLVAVAAGSTVLAVATPATATPGTATPGAATPAAAAVTPRGSGAVSAPSPLAVGLPAGANRPMAVCYPEPGQPCATTTPNWSGYVATPVDGTFSAVSATWTVTKARCPQPNGWTLFWVGLDGWNSDTVEQGGTYAQCVGGTPTYEAWWEMYDDNEITPVAFTPPIVPGDTIDASVVYDPDTASYTISVADVTTGQAFSVDEQCGGTSEPCENSSAEWVVEAPGYGTSPGYYPLARFAPVTFSSASATNNQGVQGAIIGPGWETTAVDMTNTSTGTYQARALRLRGHATSFTDTWQRG